MRYRLPETLSYYKARKDLTLRAKDSLATDNNSTAVIQFKSGVRLEIQPNSLIIIDDIAESKESLEVAFLRGEVKVLNEGTEVKKLAGMVIKQNVAVTGSSQRVKVDIKPLLTKSDSPDKKNEKLDEKQAILAAIMPSENVPPPIKLNLNLVDKPKATQLAQKPLPSFNLQEAKPQPARAPLLPAMKEKPQLLAMAPKKKTEGETLPESYITSVIREKKSFLDRCWTQHTRFNSGSKGRIDFYLTIEPTGIVSSGRVLSSTIPDPTLQQCLLSTLLRCKFKSFQGNPIPVRYPINFE